MLHPPDDPPADTRPSAPVLPPATASGRVSRRALLTGGGVTFLLGAGGTLWRASDQGVFSTGTGAAYEPWRTWRADPAEGPMALARAAILAASPHNSQPWLFRIGTSRIDLFADVRRGLGTIDPYRREMYIGLGCAVENLLLAAQANGYAPRLALLPDPADPAHAARVDLVPGPMAPSPLYHAIPRRHTNRGPYETGRTVAPDTLPALTAVGGGEEGVAVVWFRSEAERRRVGELIVAATEAIIADAEQSRDSAR